MKSQPLLSECRRIARFAMKLAAAILAVGVFGVQTVCADTVTVTVADVTVQAGDQVDVPIVVKGAVGMSAFQALLTYDPKVLEFSNESADVLRGEIVPSNAIMQVQTTVPGRLPIIFLGGADAASQQVFAVQADGTLVTIRFKVIGAAGETTKFGLERAEAFQVSEMDLMVETQAGQLTIASSGIEFQWWWLAVASGVVGLLLLIVWFRGGKPKQVRVRQSDSRAEEGELVAVADDESVKHQCVGCGRRMTIPPTLIGKKFKCPKCGASQNTAVDSNSPARKPANGGPAATQETNRQQRTGRVPADNPANTGPTNQQIAGRSILRALIGLSGVALIVAASVGGTIWYFGMNNRIPSVEVFSGTGSNMVSSPANLPQQQLVPPNSLALIPQDSVAESPPARTTSPLDQFVPRAPQGATDIDQPDRGSATAATALSDPVIAESSDQNTEMVDTSSAEELGALGRLALDNQAPREALELLRKSVALDPSDFATHVNLGHAARQVGEHATAVDAYRQAAKLNPSDDYIVFCLATGLALAGQLDESILQFQQAIKLNPTLPESYNSLGEVLYARFLANVWRGKSSRVDLSHAAYCFYRARNIAPDEEKYTKNLHWLIMHLSKEEHQTVGLDVLVKRTPWTKN